MAVEARAVRVAVARREMLALEPGDDAADDALKSALLLKRRYCCGAAK